MKPLPANTTLGSLGSTNDHARALALAGAPHGTWIAAREQTAGRGRLAREWRSETGNLFLSVVLRPEPGFPATWVPLATALALHRAAKTLRPDLDLVLKWPNDLGLRGTGTGTGTDADGNVDPEPFRKVGGILCEGAGTPPTGYVIAGIGVNCRIAPAVDQPTAALGTDPDPLREALLAELVAVFREGMETIRRDYLRVSWISPGSEIEWTDAREGSGGRGRVLGYGDHGELVVAPGGGAAGNERVLRLYSEEVRVRRFAR